MNKQMQQLFSEDLTQSWGLVGLKALATPLLREICGGAAEGAAEACNTGQARILLFT